MAMTQINYLSLTGLNQYDAKIKSFIAEKVEAGDKQSFKFVNLEDGVLKFYTVNPITENTVADFEIELPEQDLSNLMQLVKNATSGNIASFGENGQVVDSGLAVADIATKSEVEAVDAKADAAQADVDALAELVGELPEGTSAKDVVDYVNIKTAGIATDAALEELNNQVSGLQTAVQDIQKDYLVEADKTELQDNIDAVDAKAIANDTAIKAIQEDYLVGADKEELQDNIDTLTGVVETLRDGIDAEKVDGVKDLIDYVDTHGAEVTGMQEAIEANAVAIGEEVDARELLAGRVEELEAIDFDAYVAADATLKSELEGKINAKADASVVEGIDAAYKAADEAMVARIAEVEGKAHVHANADVINGITAEKVAAWDAAEGNAKAYVDEKIEGVDLSGIATNAAAIEALEAELVEGGATYTSIAAAKAAAEKAQGEVDALEELHATDKAALVKADEEMAADIAALKEIEHVEITNEQIDALFTVAE